MWKPFVHIHFYAQNVTIEVKITLTVFLHCSFENALEADYMYTLNNKTSHHIKQ